MNSTNIDFEGSQRSAPSLGQIDLDGVFPDAI
jgi:hypothetical protein